MKHQSYCDGILRRDFLKVGALAGAGLSLSDYLSLAKASPIAGKVKSAIYVRLAGGPSHMDTFDMKPGAPDTHRGEFKEISTNVPSIRISEHLPKLARCADKYAILRGVSHSLAAHRLGAEYLMTGNRPLPSLKYSTNGAVISKELGGPRGIPRSVAIPKGTAAPTGDDRQSRQTDPGVGITPGTTNAFPRAWQAIFAWTSFLSRKTGGILSSIPRFSAA